VIFSRSFLEHGDKRINATLVRDCLDLVPASSAIYPRQYPAYLHRTKEATNYSHRQNYRPQNRQLDPYLQYRTSTLN